MKKYSKFILYFISLVIIFAFSLILLSNFIPLNLYFMGSNTYQKPYQIHEYYLIIDEDTNNTLMYVPIVVNIGDEVLSEENIIYTIVKIEKNKAYARKTPKKL